MATNFFECEFPRTIAYKAMGGPGFNTSVNEGKSGFEQRNQNWATARGKWTISLTTPAPEFITSPKEYIEQLNAFFLVVHGKARGFRLKDHKDFTHGVAAQTLGVGDGATSQFQLIKTYSVGGESYVRTIYKPITSCVVDYQNVALADTVAVTVGGVTQPHEAGYVGGGSTNRYVVDQTTGLISFNRYSVLALTTCTMSGTTMTVAYSVTSGDAPIVNQQIVISGYGPPSNNGTFLITGTGTGTFSVTNASGSTTTTDTGTGTIASSVLAISAVSQSGGVNTYTYTLTSGQTPVAGMRIAVAGFSHSANNGVKYIASVGSGVFAANVASGYSESTGSGFGYADWVPATNAIVAATFQYHFPVRFDTDELSIQIEDSDVAGEKPIITWNSITLRELRMSSATQG